MSAILTSIIKLFVAILPFVVTCLAAKKVNLPKPDRSKQFIMPIVAIGYVIVAMFLMKPLNSGIILLFGKLPALLGLWVFLVASDLCCQHCLVDSTSNSGRSLFLILLL